MGAFFLPRPPCLPSHLSVAASKKLTGGLETSEVGLSVCIGLVMGAVRRFSTLLVLPARSG